MTRLEYKVVPAPQRGQKAKGVKGTPARFALALEQVINEMAAEGWTYLRAETLPVEERQGLTGRTSTFQNMLVFQRSVADTPETLPVAVETPSDVPPPEDDSDAVLTNDEAEAPETAELSEQSDATSDDADSPDASSR